MYVPKDAPPLITFKSPDGGLGLRTKSVEGARKRFDGLFAECVEELSLDKVELSLTESCERRLVEALHGPLGPDTAFIGGGAMPAPGAMAQLVAEQEHRLDEVADEGWRICGVPQRASAHQERAIRDQPARFHVGWIWATARPDDTVEAFERWFALLSKHQKLLRDDYATRLHVHASWSFRLRSAKGTVAAAPYPRSEISAWLSGKHASAFFDLVFPYESAQAEGFGDDYEAVCRALGLRLPPKSFRLCKPRRRGDQRSYVKLAGFG